MLKIENVTVRTKGDNETNDITLLNNVCMEVGTGEVIVLNGKNGSGKSSLLSAIMGHPNYQISEGDIVVDGINLKINDTISSAQAGLYITMQSVPEIEGISLIQLLHKAITKQKYNRENKNENNKSRSQMSILDLNKEMNGYCEEFGIDKSFIQRDLNYKMSGGEKKQCELLHMLALRPKYVLLDEIDSGVDRDSIDKIYQVINYLKNNYNTGFIIVSHHTDVSKYTTVSTVYYIEDQKVKLVNK